jgi:hypothetical protein
MTPHRHRAAFHARGLLQADLGSDTLGPLADTNR